MSRFLDPQGRLRLRWRLALFFAGLLGTQLATGVLIGAVWRC